MKKTYLLALCGLFNTCVGVQAADISVAPESVHRSCAASSAISREDDVVMRAVETFKAETIEMVKVQQKNAVRSMEAWFNQLELKLSTLNINEEAQKLFLYRVKTSTVECMLSSAINFTISSEETACVRRYLMMLRDIEEENKGLYKVLHSITSEKIDLSAARKWLASDLYLRVMRLEGYLRARKSG